MGAGMTQKVLTSVVLCVTLWSGVAFAQTENGMAMLENPAPDSHQSGVSVISGWACDAENIVIEIDGTPFLAAYGTVREDTQEMCGDTDNGFSFLWNWSNSGDGEHTVRALSNVSLFRLGRNAFRLDRNTSHPEKTILFGNDGTEFGTATVTVTTFGTTFLREAQGSSIHILDDFPATGEETRIQWAESLQNFVIRDNPAAFTQDFVQAALDRYDRDGREATLAYYNDPASIEGQWCVFIIDENDLIVAHPVMHELIGRDVKTVVGSDGYELGKEIATATEAGHWIHDLWFTPSVGGAKHTWVIRHDGLIFGSGYYEPTDSYEFATFFVGVDLYGYSEASDYYSRVPDIAAVLENPTPRSFRSGISAISGWACDAEEIVIEINGEPLTAAYGTIRADTAEVCGDTDNGFSLLWNWNNLGDGVHTVRAHIDGVPFAWSPVTVTTFGDEMLGDEEKATFTRDFVQTALDHYDSEGREATVAYYNSQASIEGEWYVFIIDENDLFLSHAPTPALLGTDVKTIVGSDGYELGKEIATATETGHWIHYLWPNPVSGEEEPKHSWVIRHNGLIFGSGYYGPPNFQEYELADFPAEGSKLTVQWSQPLQNFVITDVRP